MARRYPWTVLDIDPTDDEAAIRKAYAVKLKVTRPDENPEGFQHLREARDAAIVESRFVRDQQEEPEEAPVPVGVLTEHAQEVASLIEEVTRATVDPPEPANRADPADVGTVVLGEPPDTSDTSDEEESSPVAGLLDKVGTPHPWRDLKAQWADVFDAMEADTLANHGYNMWLVLPRLLDHIRRDAGQLPDVSGWPFDPTARAGKLLGDYAPILKDFENRFGILHQDTVLLEYMSDEDAREFINALTIAVGREASLQPGVEQTINVPIIEERHVRAVWADDAKMLDFYRKARERDDFPWSFNVLALLFPLPVALYYRLTSLAVFATILMAANAAFAVMRERDIEAPFAPLASTVYLILAGAFAFNWRRMRVSALATRIRKLNDDQAGTAEFGKGLIDGTKPSVRGAVFGVVILIVAITARVLART